MPSCRRWGSWMSTNATAGSPGAAETLGVRMLESSVCRRAGRRAIALCLTVFFLPSAAVPGVAEPSKPTLKPIDVFGLEWVADPQVSPDGRRIAYVRMSMDLKTDQPRGEIWLEDSEGKHARPLSSADSSSHPRWSPDGTRIAYLGTGGDGSHQLFMYWVDS